MRTFTELEVARLRLASLRLASIADQVDLSSPAQIASWFGAMQAQDFASGLWSFGVRLPQWSVAETEATVERGEVLRTWTQRGTIHFTSAEDARWLLELCGSRMLRQSARRRESLGITQADCDRAIRTLRERLSGCRRMTRAEIVGALAEAGVAADGQRAYHLLWFASQLGVTCIGPNEGRQQTYVLLDEWAPEQRELAREEALAELSIRYFQSHGPTTVKDFAGWSGLTMKDCRAGVELAGDSLERAQFAGADVYLAAGLADSAATLLAGDHATEVTALPSFDEFLLGYKDRCVQVPADFSDRIIPGNNGVFQNTIMQDGRVIATWKRSVKKRHVDVAVLPFNRLTTEQVTLTRACLERYAAYLGLELRATVETVG